MAQLTRYLKVDNIKQVMENKTKRRKYTCTVDGVNNKCFYTVDKTEVTEKEFNSLFPIETKSFRSAENPDKKHCW